MNLRLDSTVRLNTYKIVSDAIENGIKYGYRRAHKHIENPSEDTIIEQIHLAVMNDLCDIINFDDDK
jgi:hypothetical protein